LQADLNTNRPYTTIEEIKLYQAEYNKQFYVDNKEEILEKVKKYRVENKEEI